jgi:preprotein translocase subunit SecE
MLKKAATYLRDVRQEMSKVSWPSKNELIESTAIVLFLSAVLAVFTFVVDTILTRLVQLIM